MEYMYTLFTQHRGWKVEKKPSNSKQFNMARAT